MQTSWCNDPHLHSESTITQLSVRAGHDPAGATVSNPRSRCQQGPAPQFVLLQIVCFSERPFIARHCFIASRSSGIWKPLTFEFCVFGTEKYVKARAMSACRIRRGRRPVVDQGTCSRRVMKLPMHPWVLTTSQPEALKDRLKIITTALRVFSASANRPNESVTPSKVSSKKTDVWLVPAVRARLGSTASYHWAGTQSSDLFLKPGFLQSNSTYSPLP